MLRASATTDSSEPLPSEYRLLVNRVLRGFQKDDGGINHEAIQRFGRKLDLDLSQGAGNGMSIMETISEYLESIVPASPIPKTLPFMTADFNFCFEYTFFAGEDVYSPSDDTFLMVEAIGRFFWGAENQGDSCSWPLLCAGNIGAQSHSIPEPCDSGRDYPNRHLRDALLNIICDLLPQSLTQVCDRTAGRHQDSFTMLEVGSGTALISGSILRQLLCSIALDRTRSTLFEQTAADVEHGPCLHLYATDLNPDAVLVTRRNIEEHIVTDTKAFVSGLLCSEEALRQFILECSDAMVQHENGRRHKLKKPEKSLREQYALEKLLKHASSELEKTAMRRAWEQRKTLEGACNEVCNAEIHIITEVNEARDEHEKGIVEIDSVSCIPVFLQKLFEVYDSFLTLTDNADIASNQSRNYFLCVRDNFFESLSSTVENSVDLLIFNPPYVPTDASEVDREDGRIAAAWAGGVRGREVIDEFLKRAPRIMRADPAKTYPGIGNRRKNDCASPQTYDSAAYMCGVMENDPDDIIVQARKKHGLRGTIVAKEHRGIEELWVIEFKLVYKSDHDYTEGEEDVWELC